MTFRSGFVSIIGRPNVGKSTLLNRILCEKVAIISDKPQTTRNQIKGIKTYPDSQVIFVDTPGIHKPQHRMNQYMVKAALGSLLGMDIIMMLVDITQPPGKGDEFIINNLPQDETKKFLVLNKIDLVKKHLILPAIGRYREMFEFDEFIPVSALDGDNIELLEETVKNNLKEGPKYFEDDIITDTTERFFAAEIIREKLLNETREEIPYSMAVTIEMWEETDDLLKIHALVFVDRESHKPIIIGEKGSRLKKIGTEARLEMEQVFGIRIYLQIWVKVKRNWRDDDRLLHEIGLNDSR